MLGKMRAVNNRRDIVDWSWSGCMRGLRYVGLLLAIIEMLVLVRMQLYCSRLGSSYNNEQKVA